MAQRLAAGPPPPNAVSDALESAASDGVQNDAGPGNWVSRGPYNIGGRLTSVATDPNNQNHIWVGSAMGGVFESTDGGVNWSPKFDGQTSLSIGAIAVHPSNSSIVYVGTGEDNGGGYSFDGDGLYKTTDGGATWTNMGLGATRRIGKIAVDPTNGNRLFVAAGGNWFGNDTNRGLYRSTDGGSSWTKVLYVADDVGAIDVAIDPTNTQRIYAAMWQRMSLGDHWYVGGTGGGVYRSTDGGDTWTKVTTVITQNPGRIGLAIAPSNAQIVYALVINPDGAYLEGIYKSSNAGGTWTKVSNASQATNWSSYSYYFGQIRVDPTNANIVYGLDVNLLKSTNGGTSFVPTAPSVHSDFHDMRLLTGTKWYIADDGGFFSTTNAGTSVTHATTLPISQLYDIGIDNQNPLKRYAGLQDNYVDRTTTGGTSDWVDVIGGDGLQVEVDWSNTNFVYGESQYGAISKSTDGGASFFGATNGIDGADRTNWNTPITIDPVVPTTLYTGTYRVYRSTDRADNWAPISPNLTNNPLKGFDSDMAAREDWRNVMGRTAHLKNLISNTVTVVQVSPKNNNVIWAGTDEGNVWVTSNGGASWNKVNPPGAAYWVTDIAPDPRDANTAYLTVTGYRSNDKLQYLRVTRDLGATWTDLSSGLPQLPLNTVLSDTQWKGRLFVGNDIGCYWSDDDGKSFQILSGGVPKVVFYDLYKHESTNTLFGGTFARGLYSYDIGQLPAMADGDHDGVDNNHDCAVGDAGAFAPPAEVQSLSAAKSGTNANLSWSSLASQAGSGIQYDVARGRLGDLPSSGTNGSGSLACALTSTSTSDPELPIASDGFYYMVRGRNSCGRGSWGRDGNNVERSSSACP